MKREQVYIEVRQHVFNIIVLVIVLLGFSFLVSQSAKKVPVSEIVPAKKVRILIVPGHEPDYGGTLFHDVKERDLAVEIGQDLKQFLEAGGKYTVFITRDTQAWDTIFADYFKNNWDDIIAWQKSSKEQFSALVSAGVKKVPVQKVLHNVPSPDVGMRIYGITKWANENDIDAVVHIHLNDYRRRSAKVAGKYSGFAIYVPAREYSNSTSTRVIAESVFKRLSDVSPVSNLDQESDGIIDDSKLIAVGENDTSKVPSMLVEYGYIYEPQFTNGELRSLYLKKLAQQTYLGLEDYFAENFGK